MRMAARRERSGQATMFSELQRGCHGANWRATQDRTDRQLRVAHLHQRFQQLAYEGEWSWLLALLKPTSKSQAP